MPTDNDWTPLNLKEKETLKKILINFSSRKYFSRSQKRYIGIYMRSNHHEILKYIPKNKEVTH